MENIFLILLAVLMIALSILVIAASFRIFRKFGEKGWHCLIPVYSVCVSYRHCWNVRWFFMWLAVSAAGTVLFLLSGGGYVERLAGGADRYSILQYAARIAVRSELQHMLPGGFFTIAVILLIVSAAIDLVYHYRISRSFDHGAAFAAGMLFLPFIFLPILGFGSSEVYIGPDGLMGDAAPEDTFSSRYM